MSFGHPHTRFMPSPNDRSPNDPAVLVESKHIRAFVEYTEQFTGVKIVKDTPLNAYIAEAKKSGWHNIQILGKSVLLTAEFAPG
jgi:hypothetical protein